MTPKKRIPFMKISDEAQKRAVQSINEGHLPTLVPDVIEKNGKRGIRATCSCGWGASKAKPMKQLAVAQFLWHLEEISQARSQRSSAEAS